MDESHSPTPTVRRLSLFKTFPDAASDLVEMDDLGFLDGHDLRAVFEQVSEPQILEALCGLSPALRKQLLTKLSPASASRLEAQIVAFGPVEPEAGRDAQRALVAALCRLSRGGQIAFDVPEDMVA
jgi:flagellar motor switch protein FliG